MYSHVCVTDKVSNSDFHKLTNLISAEEFILEKRNLDWEYNLKLQVRYCYHTV